MPFARPKFRQRRKAIFPTFGAPVFQPLHLRNPNSEKFIYSEQTSQFDLDQSYLSPLMPTRRFPPPWTVEELDACFVRGDYATL